VIDPRSPVVVGVGQVAQRAAPDAARPPIELAADAARGAEADAGARRSLLERADVVAVVQIGSWRYPDPGAYLGRLLGISPRRTAVSTVGGNSPQLLANEFAARIAAGDCDVVLVAGAESMHTRWRARREPRVELDWPSGDDAECEWVLGDARPGTSEHEQAHFAVAPTMVYPLFETALRHAAGATIDEHQRRVSELWSTFSAVAATNPHAWSRNVCTPEEIRTVRPDNRMVCFPYPKLMCSNIDVDQGAAFILTSYEAATAAGVPADRMVFLHSGADAHDHFHFSERWSLCESPAIAAATSAALEAAGTGIDDVAHLDLYSCFPSAVQIAMRALQLRGPGHDSRPLTVTGGLGFAGGPLNNYVTHAIAQMVHALRADPGALGLTTALGWYVTKHSCGLWSTTPPAAGFVRVDPAVTQAAVDWQPARIPAELVDGPAVVEATSVPVERDGTPTIGIVTALLPDGSRAIANVRDAGAMRSLMEEPWEGRRVAIRNDGAVNTVDV
jgi:acetyl-CoA C-acetyltransferase